MSSTKSKPILIILSTRFWFGLDLICLQYFTDSCDPLIQLPEGPFYLKWINIDPNMDK